MLTAMDPARLHRVLLLTTPMALLTGCLAPEEPPRYGQHAYGTPPPYVPQGQWVPPGQTAPPAPPPVPPGPGQWAPPQSPAAFPWWPQGGALPIPNLGSVPLPGMPPVVPAMPGGPAQQCVDTINQYRKRQQLAPVVRWVAGEACASDQARTDAQAGQPHGSFGRCGELAQNVCPGWPGPLDQVTAPCLQSMANEGPGADYAAHGHYLNMMNPRYTRVACGYAGAPQGQVWAVQDFQ